MDYKIEVVTIRSATPARRQPSTPKRLASPLDVDYHPSSRTGVCHTCITPLLNGEISYSPEPLEPPAGGEVLICCARPGTDIVLDM